MSINDDYIFGEGLIKAVELEEKTVHPRIAVSDEIIDILDQNVLYSQDELNSAISIENKMKNGDVIAEDEKFSIQEFSKCIIKLYLNGI